MPKRRSHPYSIRRRSRAGAARRDRLREAAADWTAGEYDTVSSGGSEAVAESCDGAPEVGLSTGDPFCGAAGTPDGRSAPRPSHARAGRALVVGAHRKDGRLPAVTFYPNRETLEAILKAAAIVACADGQVSSLERLSLMSFLGRHGILAREGRAASAVAFDEAVREVALLRLDEACAAADGFRRIAGRPGASLVANAAAVVALADGIGWPQEIALLEVIRDRLGLRAGHQTPYTMSEG